MAPQDRNDEEPTLISLTQSTFSDEDANVDCSNGTHPLANLFCSLMRIERSIEDHDRRLNDERIFRGSSSRISLGSSSRISLGSSSRISLGSSSEENTFASTLDSMDYNTNSLNSFLTAAAPMSSVVDTSPNKSSLVSRHSKESFVSYFQQMAIQEVEPEVEMDKVVPTSIVEPVKVVSHHLPSKESVLFTAKICFMVATFTEAEKFAALPEQPFASFDIVSQASAASDSLVELSIRDCASSLVLEGFFTGDSYENGRAEVCIFRTAIHQKIIVCYKDTNQSKPKTKKKQDIYPEFLKSYECLEEKPIFDFIENMMKSYPSFGLLFTGYGFGAALATIGAVRYAEKYDDLVSCHVFGCPRVAGVEFGAYAASMSNLKVIRFEKAGDPYVAVPTNYRPIGRGITIGLDADLSTLKKKFFGKKVRSEDLNGYIKALEVCDFICW